MIPVNFVSKKEANLKCLPAQQLFKEHTSSNAGVKVTNAKKVCRGFIFFKQPTKSYKF